MTGPHVLTVLEERGLVAQTTDRDALARELSAGVVTSYVGFDPTAPSLHIGNLLQLRVLQWLQRAGHRPLALVGGATGLIGDPRPTAERTLNPADTVRDWAQRIRDQVEPFLDFSGPNAAAVVDNLEWLGAMSAIELLRDVGRHFRVGRMLAKEAVAARLASEHGISYTEFSYQVLQATDFLELHRRFGCRLQTGGSDQWGNLTAGTDLIHRVTGVSVHALSTPLVTKADGTKFGKTAGGSVWLDPAMTSPYAFYQFWVNVEDGEVGRLLRLFTFLDHDELGHLDAAVSDAPQRREAQRRLAEVVTGDVHGPAAVSAARAASAALFGGGDLTALDARTLVDAVQELPRSVIPPGTSVVDALTATGLAPSRSAARRSVDEGAVHVNNVKVVDAGELIDASRYLHGEVSVLRRGRRALAAAVRPGATLDPGVEATADGTSVIRPGA